MLPDMGATAVASLSVAGVAGAIPHGGTQDGRSHRAQAFGVVFVVVRQVHVDMAGEAGAHAGFDARENQKPKRVTPHR